jgi:hypothetical protein
MQKNIPVFGFTFFFSAIVIIKMTHFLIVNKISFFEVQFIKTTFNKIMGLCIAKQTQNNREKNHVFFSIF